MTLTEEAGHIFDHIKRRATDFKLAFGGSFTKEQPAVQHVLVYLANFCRAGETCVATDPKTGKVDVEKTLILEGRREVFLLISNYLNLTPSQLYAIYTGHQFKVGDDNGG